MQHIHLFITILFGGGGESVVVHYLEILFSKLHVSAVFLQVKVRSGCGTKTLNLL